MLERDQDDMVEEVLTRMYDTDVTGDKVTRDLGLDDDVTTRPDPRIKMTLRHQQVNIPVQEHLKIPQLTVLY